MMLTPRNRDCVAGAVRRSTIGEVGHDGRNEVEGDWRVRRRAVEEWLSERVRLRGGQSGVEVDS